MRHFFGELRQVVRTWAVVLSSLVLGAAVVGLVAGQFWQLELRRGDSARWRGVIVAPKGVYGYVATDPRGQSAEPWWRGFASPARAPGTRGRWRWGIYSDGSTGAAGTVRAFGVAWRWMLAASGVLPALALVRWVRKSPGTRPPDLSTGHGGGFEVVRR